MKLVIIVLALFAFSSACLADAATPTREVILDNEIVQVVRLTYPPGTESGMHTHEFPNRVACVVRGGLLEMIPADSEKASQTLELVEGQAVFAPANTHNVRNVGDTEIVIVETEIK